MQQQTLFFFKKGGGYKLFVRFLHTNTQLSVIFHNLINIKKKKKIGTVAYYIPLGAPLCSTIIYLRIVFERVSVDCYRFSDCRQLHGQNSK